MHANEVLRNEIFQFLENHQIHIGKTIHFSESICTHTDLFDRHFTTYSSTEFELISLSARISGARIMFTGEQLIYEICIDNIVQLNELNREYVLLEAYSEAIYRRTII